MTRYGTPTTYIHCTGTFIRETEKAIQFRIMGIGHGDYGELDQVEWFPKSQINKSLLGGKSEGEDWIEVAEWILESKDWY